MEVSKRVLGQEYPKDLDQRGQPRINIREPGAVA